MRDYDKELANSLDKSDQIAKLEAKVDELQRQFAERDADIQSWIELAREGERKLAEREAVIANMSQIAEHVITYLDDNLSYDREADYAIEQLNELRKMADEIRSK